MSEKLAACQIQISPVDDGFVIQAQGVDGARKNVKQIADTVTSLRGKLHKLVDQLYETPPATPIAEPAKEPISGGPAGTKSPS